MIILCNDNQVSMSGMHSSVSSMKLFILMECLHRHRQQQWRKRNGTNSSKQKRANLSFFSFFLTSSCLQLESLQSKCNFSIRNKEKIWKQLDLFLPYYYCDALLCHHICLFSHLFFCSCFRQRRVIIWFNKCVCFWTKSRHKHSHIRFPLHISSS